MTFSHAFGKAIVAKVFGLSFTAVIVSCGILALGGPALAESSSLKIGDSYGGGKVAYILQAGDPGYVEGYLSGLIAAESDQSTGIYWASTNEVTGATGIELGTGNSNTEKIVARYGEENNAARLCYDLSLNGYDDWYLPSKDELDKLYKYSKIDASSGFANKYYRSSSEYTPGAAWNQHFFAGVQYSNQQKNVAHYVRAVRSFSIDITPTVKSVDATAAGTIVYTFSEAVELRENDGITPATLTAGSLGIYSLADYAAHIKGEPAPAKNGNIENVVLSADSKTLTMTYSGSLVKQADTDYIVDAWGYKITDLTGNQVVADAESQKFTVVGDNIAPTVESVDATIPGTIVYTFSELMQLTENNDTPTTLSADKLAIYAVDRLTGAYGLETKTSNSIISADLVGKILTIKYDGTLVKSADVSYVVDAWGYKITDLAGNRMAPALNQIFTITGTGEIVAPKLVSIAITTPASKLTYTVGGALDVAGLVVTGTYSDATTSTEAVTVTNVSGFNSATPVVGQILTITVGEATTTYAITINAAPVTPPSTGSTGGSNNSGGNYNPAPPTPKVLGVTITLADELITEVDGKDGLKVKELQAELIRLGFLPANFTATTKYDAVTEAAVKKYQASKISVVTPDIQYSKKLNNNFIKVNGKSAVYWFSAEGKRYLFSNRDTFGSWFGDDFAGLRTISQAEFDGVQSGENVTIKPGQYLKFDNSNLTYLVKDNNNICKTSAPVAPTFLIQSGFEVDYNKIGVCTQ